MKLKILCALALLVGGQVLADGGLNISKEIKTITEFGGDKLGVDIELGPDCVEGGTHLSMRDKHGVNKVWFFCLSDKEVDEIIQALEQAKTELKTLRKINIKPDDTKKE